MATAQRKPTDSKLAFISFSRVLTYMVYGFVIVAVTFLTFGFFLLLFGANPNTAFVKFIYNIAEEFMQPFRGIFPLHQLSTNAYFSASALFAIIFYVFAAFALRSLISYIDLKKSQHEAELAELSADTDTPAPATPRPPAPPAQHPHS
jgi:uncharacterized protein YggT (Ycf19 family)